MAKPASGSKTGSREGKIAPLGDRVLVRPVSDESKKTPGGIIIPDTVDREKPERGMVVSVGPGKWGDDNERQPMSVKAGDTVVFSKYGYDEIKVDGEEYYIIKEDNILAVIKN